MRRESGFTLIEVMVALSILAVVAVAASRASSAYLTSVEVLRTKTLAQFVAQNVAAELQINEIWLDTPQSKTIDEQGRVWQVILTPSDTVTPALKQVSISVAPIDDGQAKNAAADLTVLLSNPQQDIGSLELTKLATTD
ncbi:type II secretion system minor pseudopilin GspI [Psychrobacter ciconiae]|uniref:type II secretion system minor pseudopilin GspI n=1 Tax=Psychrobacter ciconiae TaxID=1553449 RepID=UPI001919FC63|nr:type II secretion system minor pseudopilin GspI [Psychrobacter ciconiae]